MFFHRSKRPPIEELVIYLLLIITGAIPVTNAIRAGGEIGVEATIGILMIGTGTAGVLAFLWRWSTRVTVAMPPPPDQAGSDDGTGSRRR